MVQTVARCDVMNLEVRSVLSERVLLLDVGYRPLSIISVRRAILLMVCQKADAVHESDRTVRSERFDLFAPSVAKLRYSVAAPFKSRASLHRKSVFARDDYECQYCGRRAECIDHVLPRSKGGEHEWENVVACCRACNLAKGDTLLGESTFHLRSAPIAPEPLEVAVALKRNFPEEWLAYLPARFAISA